MSSRVPYDGVPNLGGLRGFLESVKDNPIVPWPSDFWDSQEKMKIDTVLEQWNTLELHGHVVTVIRSHAEKSMPTTAEKSSDACFISSAGVQNEACPQSSSSCEQYLQEETSCLKLEPKHKIILSLSGTQKPFLEQLSKDLEALDHFAFLDQRSDCLPIGEKFPTLIFDAAKKCRVPVVVLSKEYLSSKWPMLELLECVRAMKSENKSLRLFPIFYKASVADLSNNSIQDKWRPKWEKLVGGDARVDLGKWAAAVRELRGVNGLDFEKFGNSEVKYRDAIVKGIVKLAPPDLLYDTSRTFGCDRICEILAGKFQPGTRTSAQVLGLYGMGGLGKTTLSKSLNNYFNKEFSGRV